jgi:4-hydroxy-4-methyl-2-oxoglutarate aldolase
VRDVAYLQKIGFPAFGLGIVLAPSVNHYRFAGSKVPVVCDGVAVTAGDIVVVDADGVVVVPRVQAAEVLDPGTGDGLQGAFHVRLHREVALI